MQKIDKFLEFFIENLDDKRISVSKKMKYGYRYYYINFMVDEDPTKNQQNSIYQYRDNMEIIFDNRHACIEIYGGDESNTIIVEDKTLLEKWSSILEEIVNRNLEDRVINVFEKTLNECYNKNLYRELQMKKLFKEDESL
jgi:methyl coenzyme M reductase beta subunit